MSRSGRDPWAWIENELVGLEAQQLRRRLSCRTSPQDPATIELEGQRLINFSSNDYLGLAGDVRLASAASEAANTRGWGSGASPLITGRGTLHAELEERLAEFEGAEAALLFPSGYAANMGVVCTLAGPGDVVLSDARNHASIIDGCRLSGAKIVVYPHGDVAAAAAALQQDRRRALIVTDSLFSMDGDLAPLRALSELAERCGAMLLVDEAHATGVLGALGRGGCEAAGLPAAAALKVGTLSKAAGSIGGFVAGPRPAIDLLVNRARPQFFSTAMPEPAAAASLAALQIIQQEPWRRQQLLQRAQRLREELRRQGWNVPAGESQIIPVLLGSPPAALEVAGELRHRGLLAPPIRPPSVPAGGSLIRISLSWAHGPSALQLLTEAMEQLAPRYRSDPEHR